MHTITEQFIEKIIQDTKSNTIIWNSLFTFTDAHDLSDLTGFKYVLYFDDIHEFDYAESYICHNNVFCMIVLKEIFINIKNNTKTNEYNVYLSKNLISNPDVLTISNNLLEELVHIIPENIEMFQTGLSQESIKIMKTYLHEHESDEADFS